MLQDLKRRQDAERALREERAFMTRPRDPGRPHTVPRPFALHGAGQQVRIIAIAGSCNTLRIHPCSPLGCLACQ